MDNLGGDYEKKKQIKNNDSKIHCKSNGSIPGTKMN